MKAQYNANVFSSKSVQLRLLMSLIAVLTTTIAVLSTSTALDCSIGGSDAISGIDICLKLDVSSAVRTALAVTVASLPLVSAFLQVTPHIMPAPWCSNIQPVGWSATPC